MSNLFFDVVRAFVDDLARTAGPDPVDKHAEQAREALREQPRVSVNIPGGVDASVVAEAVQRMSGRAPKDRDAELRAKYDAVCEQLRQRNRLYGRASQEIGRLRDVEARLRAEARLRTELSERRAALETDVPRARLDRLEADIAKLRDDLRRSPVRAGQMRAEGVQAALELVWQLLDEHKAPVALDFRTDQRKAPLAEELAEKNTEPVEYAVVTTLDGTRWRCPRLDAHRPGTLGATLWCSQCRRDRDELVLSSVIGQTITGREARDLPRNSVLMVDSQDAQHPGPVVRVDGGWWAPDSPRPEPLDGAARFRVLYVPGREVRPRDWKAAIETAEQVLQAHDWNFADMCCECGWAAFTSDTPTHWLHVAEQLVAVGALGSLTSKETS